ncbi:MAG: N-6 DNA methylase, partial [Pseudomonadales bacterium]|nr:N-6 DNA methylase [Pseudomonadales bacterium]
MSNANLLIRLFEIFKSTPLANEEQLQLSMQLLAWAYLSENEFLSNGLNIDQYASSTNAELSHVFSKINDEFNGKNLLFTQRFFTNINNSKMLDAIHLIIEAQSAGVIKNLELTDSICELSLHNVYNPAIPPEIANYLIAIAELEQSKTIYLPWDGSGQLTGRAAALNKEIYLENPSNEIYPFIIQTLNLKKKIEIVITDPITQPKGVLNQKLRAFDTSISIPPFGIKYNEKNIANDWFNRFSENTTNGNVLCIYHILSQTKGLAVIAVPNNVLFSSGSEKRLREELLKSKKVKTVISLPSSLLYNTTLPFSVIILSNEKQYEKVLFIDASSSKDFKESTKKSKDILTNVDLLIDITTGKKSSKYGIEVSVEDILGNDSQLQPSHYVMSETDQLLQKKLNMPMFFLHEVVSFIRPMKTTNENEKSIVAYEIGAVDLVDYGYVNHHGRDINIPIETAQKNKTQFLIKGDIVLITKGSVGKVGIIGDAPPAGEGGWVASQSMIVLRVNNNAINAQWLYVFLRSDIGNAL